MAKLEPLLSSKIFSLKKGETEKNLAKLRFPLWGSIKWDGVRLTEYEGEMHTRSLKKLRNAMMMPLFREFIADAASTGLRGVDGELLVGDPFAHNAMQNTTSGMGAKAIPLRWQFFFFDTCRDPTRPYEDRYAELCRFYDKRGHLYPWLQLTEQTPLENMDAMFAMEERIIGLGGEGIMVRNPKLGYKHGRSTINDGIILSALKRFADRDCVILEILEEVENANPAELDELGRTKRSSHQENLIPKGRMGTFICGDPYWPKPFRVGGGQGLDFAFRKRAWENPEEFLGQPMKYDYQEVGTKERPRLTKYGGMRSWDDLSPESAEALRALLAAYVPTGKGKALPPA